MSKLITASINLDKIDESKIQAGTKGGRFVNLTIWENDTPDQFGNTFTIRQTTGKDEPKIYIGNGKYYEKK